MGKPTYRLKKCTEHTGRYHFVVRAKLGGKWVRKYFEKKAAAQTYAEIKNIEILNQGREGAEFPTWLRVMADHCNRLLQPHGRTIKDATEHFIAILEATKKSRSAADLVSELLAAKRTDGASRRYLGDLKHRLSRFANDFNGQAVATITAAQIDDWLRALQLAPVTRNNFRRLLIVAFNFARSRGYCLANPVETTAKAKEVDVPVGILTVNETALLLETATEETLPYFAIGAFAGLRSAELARIEWSNVDFESELIEVTAQKAKTARRRFVRMRPNLIVWLAPYRLHSGYVLPINARKKLEAVRRAAKLGDNWPDNALRHSYASYSLAAFNNAAALALELGHTGTDMIFRHYREVVKPAEAYAYWQIEPSGEKLALLGKVIEHAR